MAYTIAFFGTKPYDESSFNDKNKEFGFEIRYYKGHLNKNNVLLTQGVDAVRSTGSCLLSLCRCRVHRSSYAIAKPENSPCFLAYQRW